MFSNPSMKYALAPRASAILYNLLVSRTDRRPFLLPANICPIVPIIFFKAGEAFEFVDISPATLNMNLDQTAERLKTGKSGGIVYAHTYGDPSTSTDFFSEIKCLDESVLVIDDCCLCAPDLEPDTKNPADVLLYSTGYTKVVDLGFGGYAFIRPEISYQPRHLPFQRADLETVEQAYNASIASRQPFAYHDSDWLQTDDAPSEWESYRQEIETALVASLAHRREINAVYADRLPAEMQYPEPYQLWRFNLHVKDKKRLLEALFGAGLFASSHYSSLAGIMAQGSCAEAERLAAGVVNLFNDHHYTVEMAERTCQVILQNI
jgi:hypothetical protein